MTKKPIQVQTTFPIPAEAPKLALVVWEDALTITDGGAWLDSKIERRYEPHLFWHVGFIVKDVSEGIHITEAWSPTLISNGTQIPRGMIRSIKYL